MVDAVPGAPLSHHDEVEHRRLIAQRANANIDEYGEFTPALDFATTGDLSHSYVTQEGYFWRIGDIVNFNVIVEDTPTFTTASGALRITGLPYASASDPGINPCAAEISSTGLTYQAGYTTLTARVQTDYIEFAFQGSAKALAKLVATDITSATSLGIIKIQGWYNIAR